MNWTEDQLTAYMAKRQAKNRAWEMGARPFDDVPDLGPESQLQARCLRYCAERGWPVWHDWSQKRNQPGWPDLIVFKPEGKLSLIELKAAGGKLRKEQEALKRQFMFLGHEIHITRSFKRFVELVG
jgi:hypothetical protein